MPKKSTGYTPSRSKSNPTIKETVPFKATNLKQPELDGPNKIKSLPSPANFRFPKLGKAPKITPRTPRI